MLLTILEQSGGSRLRLLTCSLALAVNLTLFGCRHCPASDAPVTSATPAQERVTKSASNAPHVNTAPEVNITPDVNTAPEVNAAPLPRILALPPDAGESPNPSQQRRRTCRVAVIGDSLSDPRSAGGHYVRVLQARATKSRFDNYARGGHMVNQMRSRFQADVFGPGKATYTHVLVFGGVNDLISNLTAHRTNDRIQSDLSQMYRWAKEAKARVVAMTVTPWGGFTRYFNAQRAENTVLLNQWLLAQQGQLADVVVDAYALLSCGDPKRLCPQYVPPFNDGLHFSKSAHEVLAEALWEAEFSSCL